MCLRLPHFACEADHEMETRDQEPLTTASRAPAAGLIPKVGLNRVPSGFIDYCGPLTGNERELLLRSRVWQSVSSGPPKFTEPARSLELP